MLPLAGNVHDGDEIAFDPDQELQGAVSTVFELFQREGTDFAAVERFNELGRADRITGRRRIGQEHGAGRIAGFAHASMRRDGQLATGSANLPSANELQGTVWRN